LLAAGIAAALALTPGLAAAQATPPPEPPAGGPLQEIVVTATRHEESLSKVPLSITAMNQEALDLRGVKDIMDVARFTPGINIDNSGTNNISIRGIASTGGAGTTGIYIDDTPIQMRALAFNPDEALPKSFDIDRIEVLRGPQGTLFGAGSEGGTVRYITNQPSLTTNSVYARSEVSYTQGGSPSYEAGVAAGGPLIDGTFGGRVSVWYRHDGGYIDRVDPTTLAVDQKDANYDDTVLVRLAGIWAISDKWTVSPGVYYQDRYRNDVESYWPIYSNPGSDHYVSADPTQRNAPDTFWLPILKIEGDLGTTRFISNTSYYKRTETTGYDGTLYNLGFYQAQGDPCTGSAPVIPASSFTSATLVGNCTVPAAGTGVNGIPPVFNQLYSFQPLLDATGIHLPAAAANYRAPASVSNNQENFTQELRLQSADSNAPLVWTTGVFFALNHQGYLEQIHDPLLNELTMALTGQPYTNFFVTPTGQPVPLGGINLNGTSGANGPYANDSYFLHTSSEDKQLAWFGEGTYHFTDQWRVTVGARFSKTEFSFNTLTGGPQLFLIDQANSGDKKENSFTPKISIQNQYDPNNLYYATYAKGFRPGGANNPVPQAACATDFENFGIKAAPTTYNSDTVDSYELGAKNNFNGRVKIATSIYYIKWNNIQQTVIPPICQISFIANLGQAVAKGGDIQADVAVTDNVTVELAAGYTDARYTADSRLSPAEQTPIVASGDAIVGQSGQPGSPMTASLGLEYHFSVSDHESFARIDEEFQSRPKWFGAGQDQNTLQYDPGNYTTSPTYFASLRAGTTVGGWQVAAFIDNLFDTHVITNYNCTIPTYSANTTTGSAPCGWPSSYLPNVGRLERDFTFRPRTFGLTFTYRH
jgi:outer membrane receptor protein involved in Fe transport